jgi:hypothetical protein
MRQPCLGMIADLAQRRTDPLEEEIIEIIADLLCGNGSVSKSTGDNRASSLVRYLPHTPQPNVCPRGKTKQSIAGIFPLARPGA